MSNAATQSAAPTTVQAVSAALRTAGVPTFREQTRRAIEIPGVKVRGHYARSRNGRGVICVNCDQGTGDARLMAERVAAVLNVAGFCASFDPEYGSVTGVVFVTGATAVEVAK